MKKEEAKETSSSKLTNSTKKLITYGVFALTILVVLLIGYFLILPSLGKLNETNKEVTIEKAKYSRLQQIIQSLASENSGDLEEFLTLLNTFIPEKIDILHFAALNEAVAQNVGATITNIEASKSLQNPTVTTAPGVTTAGPNAPAATASTQVAPTTVSITYLSNFETLVKLVKAWSAADQFVGVSQVTISATNGGVISYTITYELPTSQAGVKATIEDNPSLTSKQKEELKALEEKIIYTASPSANSVGRPNPFQ